MKMFRWVTDLVYPPRPTELLVRNAINRGDRLPLHIHHSHGVTALTYYHDPLVRAAITEHKFHHSGPALMLLQSLLTTWLCNHTFETSPILIPIPISSKRKRLRGYNQVTVLAHAAASVLPTIKVLDTLLVRTRDTVPQTALSKEERLQNMHGAFRVDIPQKDNLPYGTYIVIDDVLTTGATMAAARLALTPHLPQGSKIYCVALAHS
jgi:ComF family protein